MTEPSPQLATLCVHGDTQPDAEGAMTTPLYADTTFAFENTQQVLDTIDGKRPGNLYTRYGMNPSIHACERHLALLEGAGQALVFGAGIAAISGTLMGLCKAGDELICLGDVYGGTYDLLKNDMAAMGIQTHFVTSGKLEELPAAITPKVRLVYFETPTNPNMSVMDIAAISELAHAHGLLTVVDSTFASPINQQSLALGADLVVHSATKYLGGHSDLTGGVVMGSAELLAPIASWRKHVGLIMAPQVAYLLSRSLRTLAVRVQQHNRNAQAVAEFLNRHPRVQRVNYPGLPDFPGHAIASRQMQGFGGMLSFVYDGDAAQTAAMVDRLRLFALAPSLGGVESLVTQPVTTSHHGLSREELAAQGIDEGLVRLSVGLEGAGDLIADLGQALKP